MQPTKHVKKKGGKKVTKKAKVEARRSKVVGHHIIYAYDGLTHVQSDIEVPIYNMEHYICTLMQRRGKYVSKGFLDWLKYYIWEKETTGAFNDLSQESE